MLKKAKAKFEAGESAEAGKSAKTGEAGEAAGAKDTAQRVLDSSHQIWLAGLGAFSRVQQEGTKVFEALVKQGEQLQERTKQVATETAAAARGAATAKAREVQQMAGGTWDKLEQVFEDRVARTLAKLGVYTQNDVQQLAARVDELAEAVNKLLKTSHGKRAPAAVPNAPKKKRAAGVAAKAKKAGSN